MAARSKTIPLPPKPKSTRKTPSAPKDPTPSTPKNTAPNPNGTKTTSPTGTSKGLNKSSSKSSNSVSSAQKRAEKQQAERDARTGKRYLKQARNLNPQAKALRKALGEMKDRRKQDIGDINRTRDTQLAQLKEAAAALGTSYTEAGVNNDKAAGSALEGGFANAVRERQDAMTNILSQGAGETDQLKAMLMAARNQSANAGEANRAFYDTLGTINQGITSLNVDTKTKLQNAWVAAEGEKEQIWRDYLEARGEALTQLGQIRTAQADAYANAEEYEADIPTKNGKKKKGKKNLKKGISGKGFAKPSGDNRAAASLSSSADKQADHEKNKTLEVKGGGKNFLRKGKGNKGITLDKVRRRQARRAFNTWAEDQDESYEQQAQPDEIANYQGMAQIQGKQQNSNLAAAMEIKMGPKAEGASLRKWAV